MAPDPEPEPERRSAEEFASAAREAIARSSSLTRKDDLCHELGQIIDASQLNIVDAQLAFRELVQERPAGFSADQPRFEEIVRHVIATRNLAQDLFVRLGCRRVLP